MDVLIDDTAIAIFINGSIWNMIMISNMTQLQ